MGNFDHEQNLGHWCLRTVDEVIDKCIYTTCSFDIERFDGDHDKLKVQTADFCMEFQLS